MSDSEQDIHELQRKDDQLLERQIKMTEDIAKLSTKQQFLNDSIDRIEKNITAEIKAGNAFIHERIDKITAITEEQQRVQQSLAEIQRVQGEQISGINNTLKEFAQIQKVVTMHENRINTLEKQHMERKEKEKAIVQENTKGKWAAFAALITALGAIIVAVVTKFI